jgi:hypothetical protein
VLDDFANPQGTFAHFIVWLSQTPWWVPGAIAAMLAAGLFWWARPNHQMVTPMILAEGGRAASTAPGRGGDVQVRGNQSGGVGGDAGQSGAWPGGRGGDVSVRGNYSYARGGAGSNAPQTDGRGGRRTKSPGELENHPTQFWRYGYGGAGANAPEYNRRLDILITIRAEYIEIFPVDKPFIDAGIDPVPVNWVNKRLEELGETWRVEMGDGGYILPNLI